MVLCYRSVCVCCSNQGGYNDGQGGYSGAGSTVGGSTTSTAAGGSYSSTSSSAYSAPSTGYNQASTVSTSAGYSATSGQTNYGQANYGQQQQQQQQYQQQQQQQQMGYNTAASGAAQGYGPSAYTQPAAGYTQQQQPPQANTGYAPTNNAYMQVVLIVVTATMSGDRHDGLLELCTGLNLRPDSFISCIARPGLARPVDICLLPAGGFTILSLAHIPNAPTCQVTIDS